MSIPKQVRIEQAAFIGAVRKLCTASKGVVRDHARLTLSGGKLTLGFSGAAYSLPAEGNWDAPLQVGVDDLQTLRRMPSGGGQLLLSVEATVLTVSGSEVTFTCSCAWVATSVPTVGLALGATDLHVLRLAQDHTKEEVEAAGLARTVADVIRRRDEAIEVALRRLAGFGVGRADLLALVGTKVDAMERRK